MFLSASCGCGLKVTMTTCVSRMVWALAVLVCYESGVGSCVPMVGARTVLVCYESGVGSSVPMVGARTVLVCYEIGVGSSVPLSSVL